MKRLILDGDPQGEHTYVEVRSDGIALVLVSETGDGRTPRLTEKQGFPPMSPWTAKRVATYIEQWLKEKAT